MDLGKQTLNAEVLKECISLGKSVRVNITVGFAKHKVFAKSMFLISET